MRSGLRAGTLRERSRDVAVSLIGWVCSREMRAAQGPQVAPVLGQRLAVGLLQPRPDRVRQAVAVDAVEHQRLADLVSPRTTLGEAQPEVPVLDGTVLVAAVTDVERLPRPIAEHRHGGHRVRLAQVGQRELVRRLPHPLLTAKELHGG